MSSANDAKQEESRQPAVYDFRANEDYYESETLLAFLRANCSKFTFQLERGDTGYMHWQGRFRLIKKRAKAGLLKLFESANLKAPNYLSPTSKENSQTEFFYAQKVDTRVKGPWTESTEELFVPYQYANIKLYPYQQYIIDSGKLENRNDRIVDCIFDPNGKNGKSTVASMGELFHNYLDLPPFTDYNKMIEFVASLLVSTNNRDPKLIFIDMPRALGKDKLFGMYSAIEQLKKGKVWDTRYKATRWWFQSPRIWVFTNQLPDMSLLSSDRWRIWTISGDKKLVAYQRLDQLTGIASEAPSDDEGSSSSTQQSDGSYFIASYGPTDSEYKKY